MSDTILALNSGSSTLKFSAYRFEDGGERELLADVIRVEQSGADDLLARAIDQAGRAGAGEPTLVGHRMVHGGSEFVEPVRVDEAVLKRLDALVHLAPLHLPPALELLRGALRALPSALHVACFDTAFHRGLPEVARRFPLSNELYRSGVRRYGFHGLSYEYVLSALGTPLPARLVVAHLGSGASMAAVRDGCCIDTTMGFTPTGGLPMGTRSGDLDPGVLVHLLRDRGYDLDRLEQLLNHGSGLKGTAGTSSMTELLGRVDAGDADALAALSLFAYAIKKQLGAYVAALGGLDCLVFTGGIGEHAAPLRALALSGLDGLGIALDAAANAANAPWISPPQAACAVRIVPTNEDLVIARAAFQVARASAC